MTKKVKIFGEARSATTYLQKLLNLNGVETLPNGADHPTGWKHGFPVYTEGALHVFLMRDVYEWTRSMLTGFDSWFDGLQEPFGGLEQPHWNMWVNMIKCRTVKYYSYLGFAQAHEAVLINTGHLKKEFCCIYKLNEYGIDVPLEVQNIESHVRLGIKSKDDPDRPELTEDQIAFIDSQTDKALESFVDNLTIQ